MYFILIRCLKHAKRRLEHEQRIGRKSVYQELDRQLWKCWASESPFVGPDPPNRPTPCRPWLVVIPRLPSLAQVLG